MNHHQKQFIARDHNEKQELDAKGAFLKACKANPQDKQWASLVVAAASIGRKMRDYRDGFTVSVCLTDTRFTLLYCEPKKGEDFGHFEIRSQGALFETLPATSDTLDVALNTLALRAAESV
jgi:hypothetical protein